MAQAPVAGPVGSQLVVQRPYGELWPPQLMGRQRAEPPPQSPSARQWRTQVPRVTPSAQTALEQVLPAAHSAVAAQGCPGSLVPAGAQRAPTAVGFWGSQTGAQPVPAAGQLEGTLGSHTDGGAPGRQAPWIFWSGRAVQRVPSGQAPLSRRQIGRQVDPPAVLAQRWPGRQSCESRQATPGPPASGRAHRQSVLSPRARLQTRPAGQPLVAPSGSHDRAQMRNRGWLSFASEPQTGRRATGAVRARLAQPFAVADHRAAAGGGKAGRSVADIPDRRCRPRRRPGCRTPPGKRRCRCADRRRRCGRPWSGPHDPGSPASQPTGVSEGADLWDAASPTFVPGHGQADPSRRAAAGFPPANGPAYAGAALRRRRSIPVCSDRAGRRHSVRRRRGRRAHAPAAGVVARVERSSTIPPGSLPAHWRADRRACCRPAGRRRYLRSAKGGTCSSPGSRRRRCNTARTSGGRRPAAADVLRAGQPAGAAAVVAAESHPSGRDRPPRSGPPGRRCRRRRSGRSAPSRRPPGRAHCSRPRTRIAAGRGPSAAGPSPPPPSALALKVPGATQTPAGCSQTSWPGQRLAGDGPAKDRTAGEFRCEAAALPPAAPRARPRILAEGGGPVSTCA